jgi:4-hydroxy-3-methylbut-2-en-1-yl diphosphate reductase
MNVSKSKYLTYCIGVNKAITRVLELVEKEKEVFMLGEVVHNPYVVNMLIDKGVKIVKDIEDVPDDSTLIIRAHGTTCDTYKRADEKGLEIIDATCSIVTKNQKLVSDLEASGYTVVLIGDKNHDEVISITSFANSPQYPIKMTSWKIRIN